MAKTVVGLFDNPSNADSAVQALADAGFPRQDISIVAANADNRYAADGSTTDRGTRAGTGAATGAGTGAVVGGITGLLAGLGMFAIPGIGPVVAAGWLATTLTGIGVGAVAGGLIGALIGAGIPEEHAHAYAEAVRRGGSLVLVRTDDARADEAATLLRDRGAADIDQRIQDFRAGGFNRFDETATPYTADQIAKERSRFGVRGATPGYVASEETNPDAMANLNRGGEARVPVVEEQVSVEKRPVVTGGARVYTRTTEQPVQQDVTLREENVKVERRPVDRPLQPGEADTAFREGAIDFTETREEPIVNKTARVVEEVAVNKDVKDRTQTVNDTVRRTDVDVQNLDNADLDEDEDVDVADRRAAAGGTTRTNENF